MENTTNVTVNGSSIQVESGLSFREVAVTLESGMSLEIRPYEVAGENCSGAYCTSQCPLFGCPTYIAPQTAWDYTLMGDVGGPYACPSNTSAFPNSPNDPVFNENLYSLSLSINNERTTRRGVGAYPFNTPVGSGTGTVPGDSLNNGTIVYGQNASYDMFVQCKEAINSIPLSGTPISFVIQDGKSVKYSEVLQLKDGIDGLRAQCVCNSDCPGNSTCGCHGDCACNYGGSAIPPV
jgi:hypothetical protein